jgi:hypothetical protein
MTRFLRAFAAGLFMAASLAAAAPPTNAELEAVCGQAEDVAHCGRLVEAMQIQRLPNLARRDGRVLTISLFPSGSATFVDSEDIINGRSYSLWDYLDGLNSVLLYTTAGDNITFTLVQRTSNRRVNEIAVWRVYPEAIRKELAWPADKSWIDAGAKWKDSETLTIEYTRVDGSGTVERALTDPAWHRIP